MEDIIETTAETIVETVARNGIGDDRGVERLRATLCRARSPFRNGSHSV